MEQYKTENEKLEKDLPTLREVVGGTWKKEEELKQLKSEVEILERKIQLTLTPNQSENVEVISVDENVSKISYCISTVKQDVNDNKKIGKGIGL